MLKNSEYQKNSPLFVPLQSSIMLFESFQALPNHRELTELLAIKDIKFVPQGPKSALFEDAYEPRIFLRGEIQTREQSWHDFYNALVWHNFTNTKKAINYLHYNLQKSRYPHKVRLPAENMLTIFDEHGVIAYSKNALLLDLISRRSFHELFWQRREQTAAELKLIIIGHGLYEKALKPFVGLSAHSLLIHAENDDTPVDILAAQILLSKKFNLRTKDLVPIPILGYPGWWPDNNQESFYFNTNYFRPEQLSKSKTEMDA